MQTFDSVSTELNSGINLIEASAGTGKTYAIAMLVLRFVVEKDFNVDELLIVTFTKAATEELKDRVRARLAEAKQALRLKQTPQHHAIEHTILDWLNKVEQHVPASLIAQRLDAALLNIDQAGIFTIHSFCQRVLTAYALESGQLFDVELRSDIQDIIQQCADDFWRKQIYVRSLIQTALLTSVYKSPDTLLDSIVNISSTAQILPPIQDLNAQLINTEAQLRLTQSADVEILTAIQTGIAEGKFNQDYSQAFSEHKSVLYAWFTQPNLTVPDFVGLTLLTASGLLNGLSGSKFRSLERKQAYLDSVGIHTEVFDAMAQNLTQLNLQFRLALWQELRETMEQQLQRLKLCSFDALISRLALTLKAEDRKQLLVTALRQQIKVALIDEFQDTDNQQWTIFSTLFDSSKHYLYLIGDPKQAIYKFRGADIYSYLAAKKQAKQEFTLGQNWRSHPDLVEAVNVLFAQHPNPFILTDLGFNPVKAARKPENGTVYYQHQALPTLMLWQLEKNFEHKQGYWSAGKAAAQIKTAVVNQILSLLNDDYRLNQKCLEPKNIAVLVRSNRQAQEYQLALQQVGIPAVLNSKESVFSCRQAQELYKVLQAVAYPNDMGLLKQALSLDWFGLDGQQLYQLSQSELALDQWTSRFQNYHQDWQQQGLMPMLQRLLAQEKVSHHLAKSSVAERILTNVHHLIELLQEQASRQHLGIHKTLAYLTRALNNQETDSDERQLRLESDADAVKIVTVHSSKGLEYGIVFCPLLWHVNSTKDVAAVTCHLDAQLITDLGSPEFETHKKLALEEQQAEDLRLLYVALTRAKYCCYLAWANVRTLDKPNQSALAYLLDFGADDFDSQKSKLQNFARHYPQFFAYQLLNADNEISGYYQQTQTLTNLNFKQRQRDLSRLDWQISSYSALVASSQMQQATEAIIADKVQEADASLISAEPAEPLLPRGAQTGNVIHSLLEFNSFKKLAEPDYDFSSQRDKTCQHFGLQLEQPQVIDELLRAVVNTPLSAEDETFCLKNIPTWQCIKEMPFYLSVPTARLDNINQLLQSCPAYQSVSLKQLSGYLTGFIDLICHHNGKYYVMDYKTNYLPNYSIEALTSAMYEHNYGLQYWLYSLVLHRYLQQRLPNYSYAQHFGGVRYLFVRGMQPTIPLSGVYQTLPDLETLEKLANELI